MTGRSSKNESFTMLEGEEIPTSWYNIQGDLPEILPPFLDPATLKPVARALTKSRIVTRGAPMTAAVRAQLVSHH